MKSDRSTLAANIYNARHARKYTQAYVAQEVGEWKLSADALTFAKKHYEGHFRDKEKTIVGKNSIAFVPDGDVIAGVVFYPGMKIRGGAYAEIADLLAQNAYLCVLVNMPLNMSVLDSDAALSVMETWPDVKTNSGQMPLTIRK